MKKILRNLFSVVLAVFENGNEVYVYKKSHRIVLVVMGFMFSGLAALVFNFSQGEDVGYLIPVLVFGCIGLLSLIIGFLGEDRAVAKIWGSGKR